MSRIRRIIRKAEKKLYASLFSIKPNKTYDVEKIGDDYSFAFVPKNTIDSNAIVYSVGAGTDLHWDVEIVKKYNSMVYIFDPTPKSVVHFNDFYQNTMLGKDFCSEFNTSYKASKEIVSRMVYKEIALWNEDTKVKFYEPLDSNHVSHSITNIQTSATYIEVEALKLSSIMRQLNHTHIDFLKLDIEGAEYDVLDSIMEESNKINVIYVEFHYSNSMSSWKNQRRINASIQKIISSGYDLVHCDKSRYYTFVKKK